MILTVTPNPSIDRTVTLNSPLARGAVHRVASVSVEPGGKGVNVARALMLAGLDAVALLPAPAADPLLAALDATGLTYRAITPGAAPVRTNITVTENDGTTTKLNEAGSYLDLVTAAALTDAVVESAAQASWVVLSGSLPPGLSPHWYADVVALLAPLDCRVAVDTSDQPLATLAASFDHAAPDLIKPNAEELAGITGSNPQELEAAASRGDPEPVVAAARKVVDRGARCVLATLGAAGAVLVDGTGSWVAVPPAVVVRSTVGAGDASLAGYLYAHVQGAEAAERLRMAVAYGSAAASLPGSALPSPVQVHADDVRVQQVSRQVV